MKASSKQNHFDVITSKVRRNRDYCVGQVFLSVVYMPTMNYSCLYLAELRSIQNRCNFATICARKGYTALVRAPIPRGTPVTSRPSPAFLRM